MSKKHKRQGYEFNQTSGQTPVLAHAVEYRIIKHDLVKVVILNAVYLAVILGLYFANQRSHLVDSWFAKLLHF